MGKPLDDEGAVESGSGDQACKLGPIELRGVCEDQVSVSEGRRDGLTYSRSIIVGSVVRWRSHKREN